MDKAQLEVILHYPAFYMALALICLSISRVSAWVSTYTGSWDGPAWSGAHYKEGGEPLKEGYYIQR